MKYEPSKKKKTKVILIHLWKSDHVKLLQFRKTKCTET